MCRRSGQWPKTATRRSVTVPETGVGARVAALAVAPAVLGVQEGTAVLVARVVVAVGLAVPGAVAGIAGTVVHAMVVHAMVGTGAAMTAALPVTEVTRTTGGRDLAKAPVTANATTVVAATAETAGHAVRAATAARIALPTDRKSVV